MSDIKKNLNLIISEFNFINTRKTFFKVGNSSYTQLIFSQTLLSLFILLSTRLIAQNTSPAELGLWLSSKKVSLLILSFSGLNLGVGVTKSIAESRNKKNKNEAFINSIFACSINSIFTFFICLFVLKYWFSNNGLNYGYINLFFIISISLWVVSTYFHSIVKDIARGFKKFSIHAYLDLLLGFINFIGLSLFFIYPDLDNKIILLTVYSFIVGFLTLFISFYAIKKIFKFTKINLKILNKNIINKEILTKLISFDLYRLPWSFLNTFAYSLPLFWIPKNDSFSLNLASLGIVLSLKSISEILFSPIATKLLPSFASLDFSKKRENAYKTLLILKNNVPSAALLFWGTGPLAIKILYGQKYLGISFESNIIISISVVLGCTTILESLLNALFNKPYIYFSTLLGLITQVISYFIFKQYFQESSEVLIRTLSLSVLIIVSISVSYFLIYRKLNFSYVYLDYKILLIWIGLVNLNILLNLNQNLYLSPILWILKILFCYASFLLTNNLLLKESSYLKK